MLNIDLPCLKSDGLQIFTATPDQRLLLGEEWFERTHIPMRLLQKTIDGKAIAWSEDQVLTQLLDHRRYRAGNRVFVLFGAAGVGKSELMAWLERRVGAAQPERKNAIVRIARTELDLLAIVGKFRHLLTGKAFDKITESRWEAMRHKPRTLSKLLVLRALESLLDSDDLITALHYHLTDLVTPHIEQLLSRVAATEALDIVSRDRFTSLVLETTLPLSFSFEVFRQKLIDGFRHVMLDGLSLPDTLKAISQQLTTQGIRPILLLDDLVQSISVFATELLDYFVTLEQGNWDVVVGITPASLQSDARGRDLLDRLSHLDTIDDRVDKLWLSDEQGFTSTFLDEESSLTLAYSYLEAFRAMNGVHCTTCPLVNSCRTLNIKESDPIFAPLTPHVIQRLFRSLPEGKGKVRALVRALHSVLAGFVQGEDLDQIFRAVSRSELSVEGSTSDVHAIARWYGDESKTASEVTNRALEFFGVDTDTGLRVTSVNKVVTQTSFADTDNSNSIVTAAHLVAVKEWLEGQSTNRQLLHFLRHGAALFLRGVGVPDTLTRLHIAKPWRALRFRRVELGVSPPMCIDDVDNFEGLMLSRELGHSAFILADLGASTGTEAKRFGRAIINDLRALTLIWEAEMSLERDRQLLEWALSQPLSDFAFHLAVVAWVFSPTNCDLPPGLSPSFIADIGAARKSWSLCGWLSSEHVQVLIRLFDDFFRLRETVIDGGRISLLSDELTVGLVFSRLLAIDVENLPTEAILGRDTLANVLNDVQSVIRHALVNPSPHSEILDQLYSGKSVPLADIPGELFSSLRSAGRTIHLIIAPVGDGK